MSREDLRLVNLVPDGEDLERVLSESVAGMGTTERACWRFVVQALLWLLWNTKTR